MTIVLIAYLCLSYLMIGLGCWKWPRLADNTAEYKTAIVVWSPVVFAVIFIMSLVVAMQSLFKD